MSSIFVNFVLMLMLKVELSGESYQLSKNEIYYTLFISSAGNRVVFVLGHYSYTCSIT